MINPPIEIPQVRLEYITHLQTVMVGKASYQLEVIENLDRAIDQLCEALGDTLAKHPRAEDLCPYFGLLWPAGLALAEKLHQSSQSLVNKNIIELGSGLGLPAMVAANAGAKVLATDIHPDVPALLKKNARLNGVEVPFRFLDWATPLADLTLKGSFDLVMGADVLYESKHPKDLAQSMLQFLSPKGEIWLTDPGRTYLEDFVSHSRNLGLKEKLEILKNGEGKEIFFLKLARA